MKYRVNPLEEKDTVKYFLGENGISFTYNSIAELMNSTKLSMEDKHNVVLDCLSDLFFFKIVGDNDLYTYKNWKSLYTKYANQDLFRVIGGTSLTGEDMDKLLAISNDKEVLVSLSLFFDIYKDKDSYSKMLESVSLEAISHSLLLMPSLYKFTKDKVQEIIANEVESIIIFAASPRTKEFLTKENFIEGYATIDYYLSEDLKDAYYDLFGESLTIE